MSAGRSVLVVDDYVEIRELLTLALEEHGFRVRTAEHGAAALETIEGDTFDVIMLDIQMPVMDGLEFVRVYREFPGHHARLVIMTAGHDAQAYAEQVQADSYLAKPFDVDALLTVVSRLAHDGV